MHTILAPAADRTVMITAGGQAQFRFGYDVALIGLLRGAVEGVTWNGSLRAWTVRTRAANIRAIAGFAAEHGFGGMEEVDRLRDRLFGAVRVAMAASRAPEAEWTPPATLRGVLLPFQRAGAAYLVAARRSLLADEMGLGKTVETIAALEALGAFPAVVVCPASLKLNWEREFAAWLPHRRVSLFSAANEEAKSQPSSAHPHPDVVIINYEVLAKNVEALRARKLAAVVFDEGHKLKERKSQCSKAARLLRYRVPVRILITGTPVLNSPRELIEPLTILSRLDDLGGFAHFVNRYCAAKEVERTVRGGEKRAGWDLSGASNLRELAGRLRATCMVRRRKRDVLPELPPRRLAMLPVDIDNRAEYETAQRDVLKWVAKRAGRDPAFRALIAGLDPDAQIAAVLRQAQDAVDRASGAKELVRLEALRQIAARGKIATATEWIANFRADSPGEKLVVFAWHREVLDALATAFQAPVIDGDTPTEERQRLVDAFQGRDAPPGRPNADGSASRPYLFVNLQAGGVGLTMTAASNVLVLELPWTPALLDQAIDRLHRIGQCNAVTAWLMLGRRTIDYPIWQLLQRKRTITAAATK